MPHPAHLAQPIMRSRRSRSLPLKRSPSDHGQQDADDRASTTAARTSGSRRRSFDSQNESSTQTRQSARVKNGTARKNPEIESSEEPEHADTNDEFDQEIENSAYLLASVDKQAYAEAQILDANRICTELLIPLALPWNYPEQVLDATTPLDLDDLPMLSQGELGDHEISRTTLEVTADPGVLQLSSYSVDPSYFKALNFVVPPDQTPRSGQSIAGTMALSQYQAVISRKRKMDELASSGKVKKLVSIRFDQTSSRSSLCPYPRHAGVTPLYLAAIFPRSLQEGHRLRGPDAISMAKSYGSYNCRPLPVATLADGIFEERIWVGRSRLAWSEKEQKRSSKRGIYRSMLTKKREDLARLKRPLAVKVSLRLNGKLISTSDAATKSSIEKVLNNISDPNAEHQASLYSEEVLDECMKIKSDQTITLPASLPNFMQCSLNSDALFQNATRDATVYRRGGHTNAVRRLRQPILFSIRSDSQFLQDGESGEAHTVGFQPPHLDCFGTVDGLIRVCCTRDGSFSASADNSTELSLVLFQEFAIKYDRCFVCWGACDRQNSTRCSICCIPVHVECVGQVKGGKTRKWVCAACDNGAGHEINRAVGKCTRCPLPSGLLKAVGSAKMHHVCSAWGDDTNRDESATKCCLCSIGTGSLIECVAEGCQVKFHPSCAVVASAFGDIDNPSSAEDDDVHLCSQYTLSMVEASAGNEEFIKLPVAFCAYHNPRRSDMFLGLYPEGCYLDPQHEVTPALRIPPRRSVHVISNGEETETERSHS